MKLYNDTPFAQIILDRMAVLGWTKSDLARRLQVSPARINNLLRQDCISEHVFRKCTYVLGLSIETREVVRPAPPKLLKRDKTGMVVDPTFGMGDVLEGGAS